MRKLATVRRVSQVFFLLLFVFLLTRTEFRGSSSAQTLTSLPYPVRIFLEADPLAALSTAVATRTLYRGLLWCLVILLPTFVLGRFFCGWICPLGTFNHFVGSLRSEKKRGAALIASNRYKRWQATKYYVLAALLVLAALGSLAGTVLDPIPLTIRSLTTSVLPAFRHAVDGVANALYATDVGPLKLAANGLQLAGGYTLLSFSTPHFRQALFIGLLFATILVLNLRVTRFWCRALCPLGALLGVASRWSLLGLHKRADACDDCNRCLQRCQGGDEPVPNVKWRKTECHLCFNCVGECPKDALSFKLRPALATTIETPELKRRRLLASLGAGAVLLPLARSAPVLAREIDPRLVRPPGSLDEPHFLNRCIRCGECMKVCPNNALQPAFTEAGLEGLWTPVVVPRIGYCEPGCILCGQVCPTGAIWEFTAAEKLGPTGGAPPGSSPIKIGTAFYDHGRCLPWAMATECIVCEEWCPTSPKAIYLQPVDVVDASGAVKRVRQPHVDPKRCTGCGACEFACPVHDRPAVYVTSIGESRSVTNQIVLDTKPPKRTAKP